MQVRLPPLSSSAHEGRIAVRQYLSEVGRSHLTDAVALVMTELVANAVMHARTEMILSVELEGDSVRVSVADGSHILPRWSPSSPTSLSGLSAPGAPGGYGPRRRRRRQGNRTPSPVGSVAGRSPS